MKVLNIVIALVVFFGVQSCKKKKSDRYSNSSTESNNRYYEDKETESYPDDTYCADVDYSNTNTGINRNYTLNVVVEDNEVVEIKFSSGWLDSSEFSSEELDSDGYCDITLYDGRHFEIQISGPECSFDDGYQIENDIEEDKAALTCPNCGAYKYEYDELCEDCQNEEDTEDQEW